MELICSIKPIEIIVGVLAIAIVLFTVIYNFFRRKKGGANCRDCTQCPYSCPSRKYCDLEENKDNSETKETP